MKNAILVSLLSVHVLFAQSPAKIKAPIALGKLSSGDLFALTQSAGVYRFHQADRMLSPAGSFPLPPLPAPSDIVAAIANGEPTLFIASTGPGGGYVSQYALDGKLRFNWRAAHVLSGLDFDPKTGMVYVASYDSAEIYEASINDHSQMLHYCGAILGARELGPVIVDDSRNQLLVGEMQNGEVYSFNLKTRKSHLLASRLRSPQALLLSADSRQLFIADAVRRTIYRLDLSKPNATPIVFSAGAMYKEPVGLALLSSGYIVVADDRADALFIVSPSGVLMGGR